MCIIFSMKEIYSHADFALLHGLSADTLQTTDCIIHDCVKRLFLMLDGTCFRFSLHMFWDTYFCIFMSEVTFDSRKQADSVNHELSNIDVKMTDTAVLDRQQRLTS